MDPFSYYVGHTRRLGLLQEKRQSPQFASHLAECQMKLGQLLPLADTLLKPVQRLLKYPLLFREMVKAVQGDPEAAALHQKLKEVEGMMEAVVRAPGAARACAMPADPPPQAARVNELKRAQDLEQYVDGLQQRLIGWDGSPLESFGKLCSHGTFMVEEDRHKPVQRQVLLFEYGLLLCKARPGGGVSIKSVLRMTEFNVETVPHRPPPTRARRGTQPQPPRSF